MGAVLGRGEGASCQDWRAKETKIVGGYVDALHLLGIGPASEVEPGAALVVARDILENAGLLTPDVELRHVGAGECSLRPGIHQLHQCLRLGIGKGLEQHGVDDRKDGCIRPNSDRNHDDGDGGEPGHFGQ